jgi:hypothetical protein
LEPFLPASSAARATESASDALSCAVAALAAAPLNAATIFGSRSSTSLSWAESMSGAALPAAFSTWGAAAWTLSCHAFSARGVSHAMKSFTRGCAQSLAFEARSLA